GKSETVNSIDLARSSSATSWLASGWLVDVGSLSFPPPHATSARVTATTLVIDSRATTLIISESRSSAPGRGVNLESPHECLFSGPAGYNGGPPRRPPRALDP